MALCSGIKADGGRCKAQATKGSSFCVGHDPEKADARKRRASKGGRGGGRGRPSTLLTSLRDENADIRKQLLDGGLLPSVAAVAIQSLNCDIRAVATMLKAREQEEIVERLEELEARQRRRESGYGA
jgi:hypothetical protein